MLPETFEGLVAACTQFRKYLGQNLKNYPSEHELLAMCPRLSSEFPLVTLEDTKIVWNYQDLADLREAFWPSTNKLAKYFVDKIDRDSNLALVEMAMMGQVVCYASRCLNNNTNFDYSDDTMPFSTEDEDYDEDYDEEDYNNDEDEDLPLHPVRRIFFEEFWRSVNDDLRYGAEMQDRDWD
jgi:hypothetical protein